MFIGLGTMVVFVKAYAAEEKLKAEESDVDRDRYVEEFLIHSSLSLPASLSSRSLSIVYVGNAADDDETCDCRTHNEVGDDEVVDDAFGEFVHGWFGWFAIFI